ncbi:right-handed parallel beta-helix repeat-containing protein [Kineosporia sp. J2-2]|uniref:Right-handed parallel beta-helix repeat-containing protein n=1 Tax=Kineosporia corallincola TaxID=2835133 RepID=A0ABS5T9F8_9ACTN|nr:right-handed parallel beta-helix repeat-containing protein [Kineosporia corallincola]MBT0767706.1 right-handed parallel beta-helix repeat-containing protein [Kineosporia corallincola]
MRGERLRLRQIRIIAGVIAAAGLVVVVGVTGVAALPRPAAGGPAGDQPVTAAKAALANPPRQARLVTEEDQRVTQALLKTETKPYRAKPNGQYTLVLTARRRPYSFDDLRKLAPDTLIPQTDKSFLLLEHILVGPGATLSISPSRPLKIKMSSGPDGFVSMVAHGGRIRLNGTATAPISITSWDETRGRPDMNLGDGRAYVRVSGQMVATSTTFSRLGFWSGRTGGVAVVSAAGATPNIDLDAAAATGAVDDPVAKRAASHTDILPTGKLPLTAQDESAGFTSSISDTKMVGNAFGLFLSGVSRPEVTRTRISKSLVDGLVLHRNVESALITMVEVDRSAVDGVVINRNVESATLTRLEVHDNGRDGVVMSGSPLADGPSPSGAAIRPFGNNLLDTSTVSGNGRLGVHVSGGRSVTVAGNTVSGGRSGIVVSDSAREVMVNSNTVKDVAVNGIQVRDGARVEMNSNNVIGAATGVHVRDAVANLRDNSTSGVTLHAFTFVGVVAGSVADGNQLRGSGTSAIDLVRVSGDAPEVSDTDDSGWSRTVTRDSLVSILLHPLTMVWMGVGLLLILMRSRPRRGGTRAPYRTDPLLGTSGPDQVPVVKPAREREKPVYRPAQTPETVPAAQIRQNYQPPYGQQQHQPHQQQPRRRQPGYPEYLEHEPPVAAEWLQPPPSLPRQKADRPKPDMIDLAIAESRREPAPPRRRRAVGR